MKKFALLFVIVMLALVGCSFGNKVQEVPTVKVGMVTDISGIEDKSFSQITWKGVSEFAKEHQNVEAQYVTPSDNTLPTLVSAVDNLVLSGNKVIVLTGFVFEETAGAVAEAYPDVKFILIDGKAVGRWRIRVIRQCGFYLFYRTRVCFLGRSCKCFRN